MYQQGEARRRTARPLSTGNLRWAKAALYLKKEDRTVRELSLLVARELVGRAHSFQLMKAT